MTWIKICGITNLEDALAACFAGVDAVGFIFAPSPRRIEPVLAKKVIAHLPKEIWKVGVFVDEEPQKVKDVAEYCGLTALQFHGRESPWYCRSFSYPVIKTIRMKDEKSLNDLGSYQEVIPLLDTYHPLRAGGTGIPFPWEMALKLKGKRPFILSGGLTASRVRRAIRMLEPWGVDVCSGVEIVPGEKDLSKIRDFIREVKAGDESN